MDQETVLNGNLRHQTSEVCLGPHPPAYMHCMLRISFFVRTSFHGINPPIRTNCKLALQIKTINCKAYWMRIDQQLTTTANISWCLHFYWFPCEMIYWKRAQKFHTDDPRGGTLHMKWEGMLIVSVRAVNFGFWSHFGFSGQNTIIFSSEGLV